jgi:hypothetical protein
MPTYPLTLPTGKTFSRATFRPINIVGISQSPFTGQVEVLKHQGEWWEVDLTLPPMLVADAQPWASFLTDLQGIRGHFHLGDPSQVIPRGSASSAPGTPLVNGSTQVGDDLICNGAPINTTGYLLSGDYIGITAATGGQNLHKVLSDVDSDGSGNFTCTIWPTLNSLNTPVNDGVVVVSNAQGRFRLSTNTPEWSVRPGGIYEPLSFGVRSLV